MSITYPPEMLPTADEGESGIVISGDTIIMKADTLKELLERAHVHGWNAAMASEDPDLREHFPQPEYDGDEEDYAGRVIAKLKGE